MDGVVKVAVSGALGSMGKFTCAAVLQDAGLALVAAVDPRYAETDDSFPDYCPHFVTVESALGAVEVDVLVDFTQPGTYVLLCFVPALFEIAATVALAPWLLGVSVLEAALIGSVLAAVSPAVVVPRRPARLAVGSAADGDVIGEVGARDIPEIIAFNKSDLVDDDTRLVLRGLAPDAVFVSARTGEGVDALLERIQEALPRPAILLRLLVPYDRGEVLSRLHVRGSVVTTDYREDGTLVTARIDERDAAALAEFVFEG